MQLAKVVITSALILVVCAEGLPKALQRPQRSADTQSRGNSVNTSSFPYIEVLRGRDGRDGRDGVPGPRGPQGQRGGQGVAGPPGPRNGGVVYTRWGKSTCPNVSGTTLVYTGRAGGTWYQKKGGAANYLCMPDDPDYLSYLEYKGGTLSMEQSMRHFLEVLFQLLATTMYPVLCAMLQQGWQSQ